LISVLVSKILANCIKTLTQNLSENGHNFKIIVTVMGLDGYGQDNDS
jgi:hypothetical protein